MLRWCPCFYSPCQAHKTSFPRSRKHITPLKHNSNTLHTAVSRVNKGGHLCLYGRPAPERRLSPSSQLLISPATEVRQTSVLHSFGRHDITSPSRRFRTEIPSRNCFLHSHLRGHAGFLCLLDDDNFPLRRTSVDRFHRTVLSRNLSLYALFHLPCAYLFKYPQR